MSSALALNMRHVVHGLGHGLRRAAAYDRKTIWRERWRKRAGRQFGEDVVAKMAGRKIR